MKKNLSVLLVVAMAVTSLTACGSKSEEAASDAASGGSSTEAAATAGSNDIASLQNLDKLEVKALDEINPSDYIRRILLILSNIKLYHDFSAYSN